MNKKELRTLLADNKIEDVLLSIRQFLENYNELNNRMLLLEGQYRSLGKEIANGLITDEDKRISENKIRHELIQIIDEIGNSGVKKASGNSISIQEAKTWIEDKIEEKGTVIGLGWDVEEQKFYNHYNEDYKHHQILEKYFYNKVVFVDSVLSLNLEKKYTFYPKNEFKLESSFSYNPFIVREIIIINIDFREIELVALEELKLFPSDISNKLHAILGQTKDFEKLRNQTDILLASESDSVYMDRFKITLSHVHANKPSTKWKYPVSGKYCKAYEIENDPVFKYENEHDFNQDGFSFYLDDAAFCKRLQKALEFAVQYYNPPRKEVF